MIVDYFAVLKDVIFSFSHIISDFSAIEKIYSENKGFIGGEIVFINDSRLDFAEVKDTEQSVIVKYRYHYMDDCSTMIFRYDNAKHYPDLKTFPHHKHIPKQVIESEAPSLKEVLEEIEISIL